MVIVRIEKVNPATFVNTSRGKSKIARIEVMELSLKKRYKVTVWLGDNDFIFSNGDEVEMDLRRRNDKDGKAVLYRGEEQWSCDYNSIAPVELPKSEAEDLGFPKETPPPEEPQEETEKEMWDRKERRERKGRCIMYALDTLKMSLSEKLDDLTVEDIENRVKDSADRYLDYIYREG